MTAAIAIPRNTASTFLTHFFGSGLADDRYVVERFKVGRRRHPPLHRRGAGHYEEGPAQGQARHRHLERYQGDAVRTHRDHRLHRAAHPGRPAVVGRSRNLTFPRPPAERLSSVLPGRPAGTPPAGPSAIRIPTPMEACHGLCRSRNRPLARPRALPQAYCRTHRSGIARAVAMAHPRRSAAYATRAPTSATGRAVPATPGSGRRGSRAGTPRSTEANDSEHLPFGGRTPGMTWIDHSRGSRRESGSPPAT